jgi:peptidoglycan/xylan/chitin deacetylase (PgdA/CDA1 family)
MLIIVCIGAFLFYASYDISSGIYLKAHCRISRHDQSVAITFDDGVDEHITPLILDILKRYNAKATFFLIGKNVELWPDIVKRIVDEGHDVGNHSYTHKWYFPMQGSEAIFDEITMCSTSIEKISGEKTVLFRPPFGVTNPMVGQAVKRSGLTTIGWSIRSFDTMGVDPDKIIKRIEKRICGGDILLLHDNRSDTPFILERVLEILNDKSLETKTISDFLKN